MAIRVTCPSCKSDVHVDDGLAGKEILCPSCQQRVTVPSMQAGRPEARPGGSEDDDEGRYRSERAQDLPRWSEGAGEDEGRPRRRRDQDAPRWNEDDDYDVPVRRDSTRWNSTLTGLGMMFWTGLVMFVMVVPLVAIMAAMGDDLQNIGAGGKQGNPPPQLVGMLFAMIGLVCVIAVLGIVYFVGMCLCCTVPAESGAKGRAITAVILIGVFVLLTIVWGIISMVAAMQQVQNLGAPPPPGQLPFPPAVLMTVSTISSLMGALIFTMWMLFHKALADYFQNASLSKACKWFLYVYLFSVLCQIILHIAVTADDPARLANPFLRLTSSPLALFAVVWQGATGLGLMLWFMGIVRATRRTIQDGRESAGVPDIGNPEER